ncbi:oxidoreductase-like domain-containing protein [Leeia sp. TBRC 13508]|uniref:Oxidoreductase-like domain-containing protein n=1 Tax=Leeia speluncae TaxID=2884804 RepID=A0ABS8D7P3_9NEIS|nr:oxidoreductase-like domain-containing protein [Leeia speluncae]MCB6184063.1 oxidoreductase-like domain-containing protein [Leeia speluncae]
MNPLDNLPPEAPEPPAEGECCDSGCEDCVLDRYQAALRQYREELAMWQALQEEDNPPNT